MEEFTLNFSHLEAVLEEYGKIARDDYKDLLKEGQKNTMPASLWKSVEFEVLHQGKRYEVRLNLLDYWKYVESGRKPNSTPPPHRPILEWIKVKPVLPRPMDGKLPTPEQLSYAIAKSIGKNGIKPFPAMKQTMQDTYDAFVPKVMEAWYKDVGNSIDLVMSVFGK